MVYRERLLLRNSQWWLALKIRHTQGATPPMPARGAPGTKVPCAGGWDRVRRVLCLRVLQSTCVLNAGAKKDGAVQRGGRDTLEPLLARAVTRCELHSGKKNVWCDSAFMKFSLGCLDRAKKNEGVCCRLGGFPAAAPLAE